MSKFTYDRNFIYLFYNSTCHSKDVAKSSQTWLLQSKKNKKNLLEISKYFLRSYL